MYEDDLHDEQIARVSKMLGYGPEVLHELAVKLSEDSSFTRAGVPKHLNALVREVHSGTWHSTQGVFKVTHTDLGSKPGGPLGDICFNFLATRVLNEIFSEALAQDLIFRLPRVEPYQVESSQVRTVRCFSTTTTWMIASSSWQTLRP